MRTDQTSNTAAAKTTPNTMIRIGRTYRVAKLLFLLLGATQLIVGCAQGPSYVAPEDRRAIDRKVAEYPNGFELKTMARGLTAPSAIAFVNEDGPYKGSILIAESGAAGGSHIPRIYGFKPDGERFNIYPYGRPLNVPGIGPILQPNRPIREPIGGMVVSQGRIFVTHRDARGRGMVSSLGFDGTIQTIVADLPAQGDYGVTDIAVHPTSGRLYFGLGSATNSGVVGLDNWSWARHYANVADLPFQRLKLLGYKFFTKNPDAGLFGGTDIAVTAPFQPFGASNQLRIGEAPNGKPTSAIYSVSPTGGDLRVEAHGIRLPRGLAFNEYSILYATNNGMELRGTRPVKDDPDALLRIFQGTWYGAFDYSSDLVPISDSRFQQPDMLMRTGYPELAFIIDHAASGLLDPSANRNNLIFGTFPALSGAAKMDCAPSSGPFGEFHGNLIVALSGDRAPFATSGMKLKTPVGYKLVRVDLGSKRIEDFVYNTRGLPASKLGRNVEALERPIDVKFSPDGKLYILDYGRMEVRRNGEEKLGIGTGKLFVLEPATAATQTPTTSVAK